MKAISLAILIVLVAGIAYLRVGGLDFTNYDDPYYVTENPQVRAGLTWQGVVWAFADTHLSNWHPLTWLSHMLDCELYGLHPGAHHVTNLIFHAVNGAVLFFLLSSLTGTLWRSAIVAALFVLHPMHVESVAWMSERKDVLSAFFGISALWTYGEYAKRRQDSHLEDEVTKLNRRKGTLTWYISSLCLMALGLMSKPMLVTWPFVMLLLDLWPLHRLSSVDDFRIGRSNPQFSLSIIAPLILEKIPFFVLSAASSVITILVQNATGALVPLGKISLSARLANALVSYVRYLEKLIWPTDLAPIYPYVPEWPKERVIVSALLLAGISVAALWRRNRNPYLLVGWLWFLGTLVPVIGLLQNGSQSMADRYSYLPSIGLFFAVVWAAADCLDKVGMHPRALPGARRVQEALAAVVTTVVLLTLGVGTYHQVQKWKNTETLFRYAISVTTNNFVAYTNLGFHYANLHDNAQAMSCFQSALGINPEWAYCWAGIGKVLSEQGKFDEAISNCQTALRLDPRLAEPHGTIGYALMQQGHVREAVEEYRATLRLRPSYAAAHYDLGNALARQGQMEEAVAHYEESIRLGIESADAHNNLAYVLVRLHKLDEAIAEFRVAISHQPSMWQAFYGLGDALTRQDRWEEAMAAFSGAVRARPEFVEALNRLAWLLATNPEAKLRDGAQAVVLADKACRLSNNSQPLLLRTLAAAYAEAGQFGEAIGAAEKARGQALSEGQNELANRIDELLTLFRDGKPFREKSADISKSQPKKIEF